jgi:hypothetical protein
MCIRLFLVVALFSNCIPAVAQVDRVGAGRAIHFDGIDDYVEMQSDYSSMHMGFTITAWIKVDPNAVSSQIIFTSNDDDPLYHGFFLAVSKGLIYSEYGDNLGGDNPAFRHGKQATVPDFYGRWTHVAVVMTTENNIDLYVNGINVGGIPRGDSMSPMHSPYPTDKAKSGYLLSNNVMYHFAGDMDELTVWQSILTQEEIRTNMCHRLTGNEPGLVSYWSFDETSGTTTYDNAKKISNGILKGDPARVFSGAPVGDVSYNIYGSGVTSTSLTFLHDDAKNDDIDVTDAGSNVIGVHVYEVKATPGRKNGLTFANDHYYGLFLVGSNPDPLTASGELRENGIAVPVCVFTRTDNSIDTWVSAAAPQQINTQQAEFINGSGQATVDLGPDVTACDGSPYYIDSGITSPDDSLTWSNGAKTRGITVTTSGTYWVTAKSVCATVTAAINVKFGKKPSQFSLGADGEYCDKPHVHLEPLVSPTDGLTWQDGSTGPAFDVKDFGTYWLTVKNGCGTASDTVTLARSPQAELTEIPNVITPNGDDHNQFLIIPRPKNFNVSLLVLNRWGERVFFSSNYNNDWDGKDLAPGIYFYVVEGECIRKTKGSVSIVR